MFWNNKDLNDKILSLELDVDYLKELHNKPNLNVGGYVWFTYEGYDYGKHIYESKKAVKLLELRLEKYLKRSNVWRFRWVGICFDGKTVRKYIASELFNEKQDLKQ